MAVNCFPPSPPVYPAPGPKDGDYLRRLHRALSDAGQRRMGETVFGLRDAPTANAIPGVNASNDKWEYKQLIGGTGVGVVHAPNSITIANTEPMYVWRVTPYGGVDRLVSGAWVNINAGTPYLYGSNLGTFYAAFTGDGIYEYTVAGGWVKINLTNPASMIVSGGVLFGDWAGTYYQWDGSSWTLSGTYPAADVIVI